MSESRGDPVTAIAMLGEPTRRALYEFVAQQETPVRREEAASALGISRELAAFHLDRLVQGGLLEADYRRPAGNRGGPGAGRPPKRYRRAAGEVAVSLPPRRYHLIADVLAEALTRGDVLRGAEAVAEVARRRGSEIGLEARNGSESPWNGNRVAAELQKLLQRSDFDPAVDAESRKIYLRNCPYERLASDYRALTCGMNHAWAQGVLDAIGDDHVSVELAPAPGRCCLIFDPV